MKTTKKLNPRFFVFAALMMVLAIAAFPRTTFAAATQKFNVPLIPNYTARTPSNYIFGSGNWTGMVKYGRNHAMTLGSQVTLVGAEPLTWFILREAYVNSNGQQYQVTYFTMFTDSNGNAYAATDDKVPSGAVAVVLGVYDATHFYPPLQTMISDPDIGGDQPC